VASAAPFDSGPHRQVEAQVRIGDEEDSDLIGHFGYTTRVVAGLPNVSECADPAGI
jgi:hypothetical protein